MGLAPTEPWPEQLFTWNNYEDPQLSDAFELQDRAFNHRAADRLAFDQPVRLADACRLPAVDGRLAQRLRRQLTRQLQSVRTPTNQLRQQVHHDFAALDPIPRCA